MKLTESPTTPGIRPAADMILPVQFHHRPPARPEESLMLAILEEALACMRRSADATDVRSRRLFREANEWVQAEDPTWPFSFRNICDTLNIDAGYVRGQLRHLRQRFHVDGGPRGPSARTRLRVRRV